MKFRPVLENCQNNGSLRLGMECDLNLYLARGILGFVVQPRHYNDWYGISWYKNESGPNNRKETKNILIFRLGALRNPQNLRAIGLEPTFNNEF